MEMYTSFTTEKSSSTLALSGSLSNAKQPVDADDEAKASLELLHLIIALRSGNMGGADLEKVKTDGEAGPQRALLEQLKEVVRRIRSGSDQLFASAKTAQGGNKEPTLQALVDALPEEMRNLVYNCFPNLDGLLEEEAKELAKAPKKKADEVAQPLDGAALAQQALLLKAAQEKDNL